MNGDNIPMKGQKVMQIRPWKDVFDDGLIARIEPFAFERFTECGHVYTVRDVELSQTGRVCLRFEELIIEPMMYQGIDEPFELMFPAFNFKPMDQLEAFEESSLCASL
jgi:hypothetical protein